MPDFKKDTRGFKMKGWSPFTRITGGMNIGLSGGAPSYMHLQKEFGGTKKTTEKQKEKHAEQEKAGIQKRIDRKTKAVERKESKGSTWGLARKKRKIAKLKTAKEKADGSFTERAMEMHDREKAAQDRRMDNMMTTVRSPQSLSNSPYTKSDAIAQSSHVEKAKGSKEPRKIYDKDVYTEKQGTADHVFTSGAKTKDQRGRRIIYKDGYKIVEKAKPGAGWRETRRVEISDKKRNKQIDRKMKRYT